MTATGIAHGSIGPGAGSPPVVRAGAGDRIGARRPERSHWTGMALELKTWKLHGRSVNYVQEGSGPVLMLIHGMAGSYQNWERVIEPLAQHHTVLAPDLPGHGASAPGGGDYSIGALATELRDLLIVLGHERATFVGRAVSRGLGAVGWRPTADVAEVARGYASLADGDRRNAFLGTVRSVINSRGQSVSANDRLYLARDIPVLLVWGDRDPIIPVSHGRRAHEEMPGSQLEVFEGVGHLPPVEAPERFIPVLERFM